MKHCKKHNQDYMSYLDGCPICVGEKLAKQMGKPTKILIAENKKYYTELKKKYEKKTKFKRTPPKPAKRKFSRKN